MPTTFKKQILKFWEDFCEEEGVIREMLDRKAAGQAASKYTASLLKTTFQNTDFQLGIDINNKYELTLSPKGDRVRLIMLHYWLKYAPIHLHDKWVFYPSKPSKPDTHYEIELFGVQLAEKDIILYLEADNPNLRFNLQVYSPKLMNLSESERYALFFTFLDQYIGEAYAIEQIGYVDFIEEKLSCEEIKLGELKTKIDKYIDSHHWTRTDNPLNKFIGYHRNPNLEISNALREDIFIGYTSCAALINAYFGRDDSFFDVYTRHGIVFAFIFFKNKTDKIEDLVGRNAKIKDAILAHTSKAGIADCSGSAVGNNYSYIDLVIYDNDAFNRIIKEIMSDMGVESFGLANFKASIEPIYFQ